jgi:glycogen debranching enzyme
MPTKVSVNSGQITINDGSTFLVTDSCGEINDNLPQGFFVNDTRLISYYKISLNRDPLSLLASSPLSHHSALYQFTNSNFRTIHGLIPQGRLIVTIRRDICGGMHEDIDIVNHYAESVKFQLMLAIRSDFADIFEVKSKQILTRGETETTWSAGKLITEYRNDSFFCSLITHPFHSSSQPRYANGRLFFDVDLEPGENWHTCISFIAIVGAEILNPEQTCTMLHATEAKQVSEDFLTKATKLSSSNAEITEYYQQALVDMSALRIKVNEQNGKAFWMPAAGIPWFVAVFGRDSVTVSLQTMAVYPGFAHGTLLQLAQLQAIEVDDWRDAQPGKMLHEFRRDELTQLHQLPYTPYYGTVDTTILWIITLAEAYHWSGDRDFLEACRPAMEKALAWIEQYGDFDQDGFVEYQTRSAMGLQNQGWKDSGDAIVYADGSQVKAPIALCEVQGYVYNAWRRAAELYELWGESATAAQFRQKAADLYNRFNDRFWIESEGFYGLGLDSQKQVIGSITSNPGHLLWSGIVPPERADRLVKRLFQPDLWCGWGIRTLSSLNPAYNPISYQLGSVWPHDNAAIAMGLKQYGYHSKATQIAEGIFAAASYFEFGRMPELFGGIERSLNSFPVPYPDANIPQAWAAGSIFLLIRALLGLEANAPQKQLIVQPVLPDWLNAVELTNLSVGEAIVSLRFWREGEQTYWKVLDLSGELDIQCPSTPLISHLA